MKGRKKKLFIVIGVLLFLLFPLGLFGTGLYSVYSVVDGLVSNLTDGVVEDRDYEKHLILSDLSSYDLDAMIQAAGDPKIFDEEILDSLMMERSTFQRLLDRVKEYNTTFDEADKTIGKMHYWYETEEVEGPPDEDGNPTKTTVSVLHSEEVKTDYHVSASPYEKHYYHDIMWQSLYISAVADVLTNYRADGGGYSGSGTVLDGTLGEAASMSVVEYAKQFLGNPYVWGGESLTNGVDCSGFIKQVYAHFGVSLPHSSKQMRTCGKGVSNNYFDESITQPGDIICYDGHVALYIGDGKIIHASNPRDGIKISEATYRNDIVCVRRIAVSGQAVIDGSDGETTEIDGQEVAASDGYASNKIGDYIGGWVAPSDEESARNAEYTGYINEAAERFNLPADLIRANITLESHWNPNASNKTTTAQGLMQILDGTWDAYCVKCGYPAGDYTYKFDPRASILVGAAYMSECIYKYGKGDVIDGLGIYHWGPTGYKSMGGKNGGLSSAEVAKMSYFCNKKFTLEDLRSGAYDSVADGYTGLGYISSNGRLVLTDGQLDILMNVFKTYFTYTFDVVRDQKMSYSYGECEKLPNYGKKISGTVGDDWYEWYEPVSQLDLAETPWMDVRYAYLNIESEKTIRLDRWTFNQKQFWEKYDDSWYETLVSILPNGKDARERYDIYKGMASSVMEYDESAETSIYSGSGTDSISGGIVDGTSIGWASGGGYKIPDGYTSIEIPESAGGMSIPLYLQYDSQWKTVPFGGGNISSSGCGAASMAMIITYLTGRQVTPDMVVRKIGNRYYNPPDGQSWDMPGGVADIFGIEMVDYCTVNAEKILKYLKKGYPVLVTTSGYGTDQIFTKRGHYIVLRGLDADGRVLVNDPNDNTSSKQYYLKSFDVNVIVHECMRYGQPKKMWAFRQQ